MNEAIDALMIVAWARLNNGLITDGEYCAIRDALEALREQLLEITP